jgi:hypothetical protein
MQTSSGMGTGKEYQVKKEQDGFGVEKSESLGTK